MRHDIRRRDAMQIAYHWVNFAAIAILTATGLAIFFGAEGTAALFAWHLWAAWLLIAALAVHIWYSTVSHNNFDRMWIHRVDIRRWMSGWGNHRHTSAGTPKHGHYKLEQIVYHWVLALDVIGLIITGLILWKPSRVLVMPFWLSWGWDGIFVARILHDLFTFILVVLVLAHIYFAVFVPKNWPVLRSIFSGRVRLAQYAEEHTISPRLQAHLDAETPGGRETGAGDLRNV